MNDKLNVAFIKARIAEGIVKKYSDGGGLSLVINKSGSVHWRLSYRFDGKQKTITLGHYPILTLAQARKTRDSIKTQIRNGIDPIAKAKKKFVKSTFKEVAQQWYDTNQIKWTDKHAHNVW